MEGEKFIIINDVEYKCVFFYGYNDHYYATIYDNSNGGYIGQLEDTKSSIDDDTLKKKICYLIETN